MSFQIGLDLPGAAWEAYLHPRNAWADAAPALGKMLGGALDLGLGLPNEELRGSEWERQRAKSAYGKDESSSVFVDEYGSISETPIPDSRYGGVDGSEVAQGGESPTLFKSDLFDAPRTPGYGGVAQRMRSSMPGFLNAEDAAFTGWMKEKGVECGPDDDG